MPQTDLLLGPPGTGKTTALVDEVQAHLRVGRPDDVALVSFTQHAADHARARTAEACQVDLDDLPHFRTIHSLAYRALKLQRSDVVDRADLRDFAETVGEELTLDRTPGEGWRTRSAGDTYLRALEIARARCLPVDQVWDAFADEAPHTSLEECRAFGEAYAGYKRQIGKLDFHDMLAWYLERGEPLPVRLAVIDEAQDLTTAQWRVVTHAFANATRVVIAGDDDQSIYAWAGADTARFLALGQTATTRVLGESHRLPRNVHGIAGRVAARIVARYPKVFRPRDADGVVDFHADLATVPVPGAETVRFLARHDFLLDAVESWVRSHGLVYTRNRVPSVAVTDVETLRAWVTRPATVPGHTLRAFHAALGRSAPGVPRHIDCDLAEWGVDVTQRWQDAFVGWAPSKIAYYTDVLASGHRLSAEPRVHLSTIHAAKGAEADTVVLLTDMAEKAYRTYETDPDSEHRVFYVGVTRAIRALHVVAPRLGRGYDLAF